MGELARELDFFRVGKFGKYFFGWLDLSRDFLAIQNNLKICGSACVSWPHSSEIKVQPKTKLVFLSGDF